MKIFLDDVRQPSECLLYMYPRIGRSVKDYDSEWLIVRNYEQFVNAIQENFLWITLVSFDHDLASIHYDPKTWTESFVYHEQTGLDCARWMKNFYEERGIDLPKMYVHSMNPVGTKNIINLFK